MGMHADFRFLCAVLVVALTATAQSKRPKIGLALEGGGALGLAHIGVLEWLEENRIPIDYIAGTSMGGLVAGMYAMGKSPAAIRQLVNGINWDDVLRGEIPYRDLVYRRKEDRRAYPNGLELGLRDGISLPSGLNSGQQIGLILDRAALPYSTIKDFDELPIPFRCVGTELTQNRQEVFKDGSLARALRATMSIPAFFSPVHMDDKVYADGGLVNNLPVDVVKAMGAELIIAVHLQVRPYDPKDLNSPFGTLGRSVSVVIAVNEQNSLRSLAKADIPLSVQLQDFTGIDYKKGEAIMAKGRETAEQKRTILSMLGVPAPDYAAYKKRILARTIKEVPVPQFVEVQGTSPALAADIEANLKDFAGKPVDTDKLERDISRITGIGRYTRIDYRMTARDGKPGLLIRSEEKSYAPPYIYPGVFVDGSDFNNVQFSIGGRLVMLDVGGIRSELRTDVLFGSTYSIASEFFKPLTSTSKWFLAPYGLASDSPIDIYDDGERIAQYRTRTVGGGADIGYMLNRSMEFRTGYRAGKQFLSRKIGDPQLPSLDGTFAATSARFNVDTMDSPVVPREGWFSRSRLEYWNKNIGAVNGFPVAETNVVYVHRIGAKGSWLFQGAGGTTFGTTGVGLPVFNLGGPNRLAAYGTNEFFTNQYIYGRTGYIRELLDLPVVVGRKLYGTAFYEIGKPFGNQSTRVPNNVALGATLETLIGPITVGGAIGDSGHAKVFFQIGRFF